MEYIGRINLHKLYICLNFSFIKRVFSDFELSRQGRQKFWKSFFFCWLWEEGNVVYTHYVTLCLVFENSLKCEKDTPCRNSFLEHKNVNYFAILCTHTSFYQQWNFLLILITLFSQKKKFLKKNFLRSLMMFAPVKHLLISSQKE